MKIVFFGTSEFAEVILKELLRSGHEIPLVVTQPDRKKGRSLKLMPSPVKALALSENMRVYQPESASSDESRDFLKTIDADLYVVVAFGQILKQQILSVPKLYSVNIHSSLLPKYRGAAPVNWAIMNGETETGVTIIKMNDKMDAGDIISSRTIPIEPEDTSITINEKLSDMGAKLLIETLEDIERRKEKLLKQEDRLVTLAPRLTKEDGLLDWTKGPIAIRDKVRGLMPWPGAYTYIDGKMLKIWKVEAFNQPAEKEPGPGEVVNVIKGLGLVVKAGTGLVLVQYMQLEGKKILEADAFLRGHPIQIGAVLKSLA